MYNVCISLETSFLPMTYMYCIEVADKIGTRKHYQTSEELKHDSPLEALKTDCRPENVEFYRLDSTCCNRISVRSTFS